jgi:hypothetical protein
MPPVTEPPAEAVISSPGAGGTSIHDHEGLAAKVAHLAGNYINSDGMTKAEKKKKLMVALDLLTDPDQPVVSEPEETPGEGDEEAGDDDMDMESANVALQTIKALNDPKNKVLVESLEAEIAAHKTKTTELDAFTVKESWGKQMVTATKLCMESRLPKTLISQVFLEQVAHAKTEDKMKAIIKDREVVFFTNRPSSGPGFMGTPPVAAGATSAKGDAKAFAAQIRGK